MNPSVSELIGQIIDPSPRTAVAPARPAPEPLASVPVLIGWMLGPPAPMPTKRAMIDATVEATTSPARDEPVLPTIIPIG